MNAESLPMSGVVTEFDEHVGLGVVRAENGETYMFHCVEIGDGSRSIETGIRVRFDVRWKFSNPEAFSVRLEQ